MSISTLNSLTEEFQRDNTDSGLHAELSYDDIVASGPPARPLDFPAPTVHRCQTIDIQARDHKSGKIHFLQNVIVKAKDAKRAYFVTKKLGKTTYGSIRLAIVLRRRDITAGRKVETRQDSALFEIEWESTDLLSAVKISEFKKMHAMRGLHLEDPIKELAVMQLLGNYHPNVLGSMDVLQDDNNLYTVTEYLPGGELYSRIGDAFPKKISNESLDGGEGFDYDESNARQWFKELMLAIDHYHKKGVCHHDISLENIVLDSHDRVVLVDPGMSLRVPHSDPCNPDCVTDVSAGTNRRLIVTQGQGGKLLYAAPEAIEKEPAVDAYSLDLWAAGVVLFIMLVGMAPFKWAHVSDKRFAQISRGGLDTLVKSLDIPLSPEAIDLLQGFFLKDPRDRWTLAEILNHPWLCGKRFKSVSFSQKPKESLNLFKFIKEKSSRKGCTSTSKNFQAGARLVASQEAYYC